MGSYRVFLFTVLEIHHVCTAKLSALIKYQATIGVDKTDPSIRLFWKIVMQIRKSLYLEKWSISRILHEFNL